MSVPIYQVISPVDCHRGGITRSALKRARLLAARFDRPVHVLSFDFNPDYNRTRAELVEIGLINDGVVIHNFFEDRAREYGAGAFAPRETQAGHAPSSEDSSGVLPSRALQEILSPEGRLTHLHHIVDDGGLALVEYFDSSGRLRRIDRRDPVLDAVVESRFLLEDGRPFIEATYDPDTGECTSSTMLDPGAPGAVLRSYPTLSDMLVEWLQSYADRHEVSIFFTDYRNTDELVVRLDRARIAWVKTLHTNHLAHPFVYGAPLRPRAKIELGNASSFDALVLLSGRQRTDVMKQFGPRTTYHVVNNPAPGPSEPTGVERDMLKAVGVGRYHALKRWDYAITAFRAVVDEVPEARLELWGFGPAFAELQSLIAEQGLEDNVFLCGTTTDSARVFASAAFSVLSSPAEGFPLVPLESMAVGTPVVAFNANYGLEDQIESGIDGVLVDTGDTDALAAAMVGLFKDADRALVMGREARRVCARLSEAEYLDEWVGVLDAALEQRAHRVMMSKPTAVVKSIRFKSHQLIIEGEIEFDEIPRDLIVALLVRSRERGDDRYFPTDACAQLDPNRISFRAAVPDECLAHPQSVRDVYVSCSARNAHELARTGVSQAVRLDHQRLGKLVVKPYRTSGGNLSVKVVPYRSLTQRATKRLSGLIGS